MTDTKTPEETETKLELFLEGWYDSNLFSNNPTDAVLYFVFYIALPVIITIVTLNVSVDSVTNRAYCYFSIIVSAFNAIYDIYNRWDCGEKTVKNTKLVVMGAALVFVVLYCAYTIISSLQSSVTCRFHDGLLCVFFVAAFVSIVDVLVALSHRMALKNAY